MKLDKVKGSLIGGAVGDALGYIVEFMSEDQIARRFGASGITEYVLARNGKALISDDTQMTLFTADGILAGDARGARPRDSVTYAYRDWLLTQEMSFKQFTKLKKSGLYCQSKICDYEELFDLRAPGNTCLSALRQKELGSVEKPLNNSKGCGGIMRIAPLALFYGDWDIEKLDMEGAEIAALTHGHSLGYMSTALLTHIISRIVYPVDEKASLKDIVIEAKETIHRLFKDDTHIGELDRIVEMAVELSENNEPDIENIHRLGEGWVAEETLAIAVYCSLRYQSDFSKAVIAAVNHKGDSDSTGAVTGNILGAWLGFSAIDDKWKRNLELFDLISEMAEKLCQNQ